MPRMCEPTFATPLGLLVRRRGNLLRLRWREVSTVKFLEFTSIVEMRAENGALLWRGFSNRPHLATVVLMLEARRIRDATVRRSTDVAR